MLIAPGYLLHQGSVKKRKPLGTPGIPVSAHASIRSGGSDVGMLIAYRVSGSSSSLLCQQKELQDCRRLSRHCHPRRSQKRSSDPAGAGQPTEKAFLARPARLYPDCSSRKPRLPPGKHQAGVPHHQWGCAAAIPGPTALAVSHKLPDPSAAPPGKVHNTGL